MGLPKAATRRTTTLPDRPADEAPAKALERIAGLGSVEAAIGGRCVALWSPALWSAAVRSPAVRSPALRSRVRRRIGFVRSRVKDTAVLRFGRLTRRRSAATAASATAATAASATAATVRRVSCAVLGRQRLWVEAGGSWGGSSCPRHCHVAGRYPERTHRRGERTENPSLSLPRRSHRPADEQHGACPRVRPRNFCIFTPPRGLTDHGRRTLAQALRSSVRQVAAEVVTPGELRKALADAEARAAGRPT